MATHKLMITLTDDETAFITRLLAGQYDEFPVGVGALARSGEFADDEHGAMVSVRMCLPHPMVYYDVYDLDGDVVAGCGVPITEIYQEVDVLQDDDEYTVQIQPATQQEN